jgi:hypothetical protein
VAKKKTDNDDGPHRAPHRNVGARIDPQIHAAMEAYIAAQKYPPSVKQVLEVALSEFLEREGFSPLKCLPNEET